MDNPRGRILSLTHDANPPRAVVEVTTSLRCARCVAGKGCGAGLIGGSSEPRRIDAQVASGLDLREGDEVRIELAPDDLLHASLLAYGLPLAGAVIGAGIAWASGLGDLGAAVAALAGVALGIFAGRRRLRLKGCLDQLTPRVTERLVSGSA